MTKHVLQSVTTEETTGSFSGTAIRFTIPEGTAVYYGQPDCDGEPFDHWTLSRGTAAELSLSQWDADHRFCIISDDVVKKQAP